MTDVIFDVFNKDGNYEFSTTDREIAEFTVSLYGGYVDIYNEDEE